MNQNQIRKGDHVLVNGYAEIHIVVEVLKRYVILEEVVNFGERDQHPFGWRITSAQENIVTPPTRPATSD
jgi:hypothetical protein